MRANARETCARRSQSWMNDTFFSAVQGWVKRTVGTNFGGRYVAQVIKQVARADPKPFQQFLSEVTGDHRLRSTGFRLEAEEVFALGRCKCRADLAVYVDETPVLLIELKYRDRLAPATNESSSQLSDYLHLCQTLAGKPGFLLLHREAMDPSDVRAIRAAGQSIAHYGKLVPYLQRSKNALASMLLEYLREEGMVIDPIDTDHLFRFLHRLVMPWRGGGRVNVTSEIQQGPIQFQRLLSNLRLVAAEITPDMRKAARQDNIRSATIDFQVVHNYDAAKVKKQMSGADEQAVELSAEARSGGQVCVWAQSALVYHGKWLYVSYGIEISLRKGRKPEVCTYADILSPEIRRAPDVDDWDGRFTSYSRIHTRILRNWAEGDLEKRFRLHIRQAARSTLKSRVVSTRKASGILRRLAQ